jgi:hypothetical protein
MIFSSSLSQNGGYTDSPAFQVRHGPDVVPAEHLEASEMQAAKMVIGAPASIAMMSAGANALPKSTSPCAIISPTAPDLAAPPCARAPRSRPHSGYR